MSEKPLFDDIKKILIEQNREPEEIEQIEKAYLFAKRLHEGQYRISEEPYIIHPVEVAKILVGLTVVIKLILILYKQHFCTIF